MQSRKSVTTEDIAVVLTTDSELFKFLGRLDRATDVVSVFPIGVAVARNRARPGLSGFVLRSLCEERPPGAFPGGRLGVSQEGQDYGPLGARIHRETALLPG